MARLFTQEDIDRLIAMNKDVTGVKVGTLMLPNELEDLGYGSAAEDPAPEPITDPVVEAAPVATSVTTPFAAQDTSGAATLQQLLAAQVAPATPTDPYANLSKNQRQMLAFSALSDAGAALAGRQGGNFNAMMSRFNEQADMQRKAEAAQAQQQMLQGFIGTSGAGQDPQARIQQLLNMAMVNPSMAPAIALQVKQIQDQLKATEAEVGKVTTATGQIDLIQEMKDKVNYLTTGPIGMIAAMAPWSDAFALRNMGVTLESNLAFSTLVELKDQGGTLGAVSEQELNLLKAEIAKFNADMKPGDVVRQLEAVDKEYRRIIRRAFETSPDADKLAAAIGGRPAWLDAPDPAGTRTDAELDATYGG